MCCKEQCINCRIRIEGLDNVKTFLWLNRSIQSQVRNTAFKREEGMEGENSKKEKKKVSWDVNRTSLSYNNTI